MTSHYGNLAAPRQLSLIVYELLDQLGITVWYTVQPFIALMFTVVPTKSDSDIIFCLQFLSQILTCTPHFRYHELKDHLDINPILWIGLIHMWAIDHKSLLAL